MCGLAGFSLSKQAKTIDTAALTRALLLGIEDRGRDATGAAWHSKGDSEVWYVKHNVRASQFLDAVQMDVADARAMVLHTRYATQGSPTAQVNNHPIVRDGLVGVHNGVIVNDDDIFDLLDVPRIGEVDSEAAFALLAHRDGADVADVLPLLEGSATLAWLDTADQPGTLHLARVASSPLWVAQTRLGSVLFASTKACLLKAAMAGGFRIKYLNEIPEGAYIRVRDGRWTDVQRFAKPAYTRPARTSYYPSGRRNIIASKPALKTTSYHSAAEAAAAFEAEFGWGSWDELEAQADATYGTFE